MSEASEQKIVATREKRISIFNVECNILSVIIITIKYQILSGFSIGAKAVDLKCEGRIYIFTCEDIIFTDVFDIYKKRHSVNKSAIDSELQVCKLFLELDVF